MSPHHDQHDTDVDMGGREAARTDAVREDTRAVREDPRHTDPDRSADYASDRTDTVAAEAAGTERRHAGGSDALLQDGGRFTERWEAVQVTFVDDPSRALADAGALVEDVLGQLSNTFSAERARVEGSGDAGASTEDLRMAMQRYREFFRRLLAA